MEIEGRVLIVDLIELAMEDYDMILGMDWLSKNGATIDCKRKMMMFASVGEEPSVLAETAYEPRVPLISVLK